MTRIVSMVVAIALAAAVVFGPMHGTMAQAAIRHKAGFGSQFAYTSDTRRQGCQGGYIQAHLKSDPNLVVSALYNECDGSILVTGRALKTGYDTINVQVVFGPYTNNGFPQDQNKATNRFSATASVSLPPGVCKQVHGFVAAWPPNKPLTKQNREPVATPTFKACPHSFTVQGYAQGPQP